MQICRRLTRGGGGQSHGRTEDESLLLEHWSGDLCTWLVALQSERRSSSGT